MLYVRFYGLAEMIWFLTNHRLNLICRYFLAQHIRFGFKPICKGVMSISLMHNLEAKIIQILANYGCKFTKKF